jgi:hypothetical protein
MKKILCSDGFGIKFCAKASDENIEKTIIEKIHKTYETFFIKQIIMGFYINSTL